MITRRRFLATIGVNLLATPLALEAQQPVRVHRIGFLAGPTLPTSDSDGFRQGLREYGYVEGQNLLLEWRVADGRDDRVPGFAAELVRLKVEAVVTMAAPAAMAAKRASAVIPIIFMAVGDPVALGLVSSLVRPGGTITGFTHLTVELTGKRLELFQEVVPSLKSVGILTGPPNPTSASAFKEAQIAARKLGLAVRLIEVRHPGELEPALATVAHEHASGVVLVSGPFVFTHRTDIANSATKRRLPVVGWNSDLAQSGALFSYGASGFDIGRRAAGYVDKILKGTKPADLPVEQPTKFEFVINLKTAKALGLTIPPSILLRADQVIE